MYECNGAACEETRDSSKLKFFLFLGKKPSQYWTLLKAIYNRTDLVTVITLLLLNYNDTTLNVQDFSTY